MGSRPVAQYATASREGWEVSSPVRRGRSPGRPENSSHPIHTCPRCSASARTLYSRLSRPRVGVENSCTTSAMVWRILSLSDVRSDDSQSDDCGAHTAHDDAEDGPGHAGLLRMLLQIADAQDSGNESEGRGEQDHRAETEIAGGHRPLR